MAILKGRILEGPASSSDGGGIHWRQMDFREPGVITILVEMPPPGETVAAPGVRYSSDESEAWTLDLDAVRESAHPTLARGLPAWASGRVSVEPTPEGRVWRFDITPQLLSQ